MANEYYSNAAVGQRFLAGETASGSAVDAKFDSIEAAFDKLPDPVDLSQGSANFAADTGAANAYAIALDPAALAYATGMQVRFIAVNANTGASTLNVNGLGVKSLRRQDGTALRAGDIPAGMPVSATYDGTRFMLGTSTAQMVANAEAAQNAASASQTAASNSATSASGSATAASASAAGASASELKASQWAVHTVGLVVPGEVEYSAKHHAAQAAGSATAAGGSATAAAGSASSAALSATNASNSATAAGESEANAGASATAAAASEGNALTYRNAAQSAQTAAEAARDSAMAAYDSFDDRYLGAKASDPALDNDGNALLAGSLYFNTSTEAMKLYTGSAWVTAYVNPDGLAPSVHQHTMSEITDLSLSWAAITGKPATFAPSAHTHTIANVTGLQGALDGKQAAGSYAAVSHTHTGLNITHAVTVTGSNTTAVSGRVYVITGNNTLTLPTSPAAGAWVGISKRNGAANITIARNGQRIMGLLENMTVDIENFAGVLVFSDSTRGWVFT